MDPRDIETSGIRTMKIVRDEGPGEWCIALLRNRENQEYYGIRWNGEDGENGYPTSRGKPVWFSLPEAVAAVLVPHFGASK